MSSSAAGPSNTNDSPGSNVDLTEYAKRYGPSQWVDFYLPETGKSGITPVNPPLYLSALTVGELQDWDTVEQNQRFDMAGFTSWELMDSGCLIEADDEHLIELDGLANVKMHSLFRRARWLDSDIQIGEGLEGTYSASNEIVWRALQPALRLATLMWRNHGMWPWVDAALNGEIRKVPNEDITDGARPDLCYSFHARPAAESQQDREVDMLDILKEGVRFTFGSGFGSLGTGYGVNAVTRQRMVQKGEHRVHCGAQVTMAWENFIPLLRKNTTPSEKTVTQFFIGKTLIHEVCHNLEGFSKSKHRISGAVDEHAGFIIPDRFFEDKELSEVGLSNKRAIWGGVLKGIVQRRNPIYPKKNIIRPVMALHRVDFPSWWDHSNVGRAKSPTDLPYYRFRHGERLEQGGSKSTTTAWPIPLCWIEQVMTKEYWDVIVQKFGASALRTPEIMGRYHTRGSDEIGLTTDTWHNSDKAKHGNVVGPDFRKWVKSVKRSRILALDLPAEPPYNADIEANWQAESNFRVRSAAMKVAERLQGIGKRRWAERDQ